MNKALGELRRIERLEDVLVVNVFEQHHHFVQCSLKVLLLRDLVVLSQERISVFRKQLGALGRRRPGCGITVDELTTRLV